MKTATYIVIALLVVSLAGGAYFYLRVYGPAAEELTRFKAGAPEYEQAKKALKKYQDREKQETAWIDPVVQSLKKGLAEDIAAGRAEVAVAGRQVVVNIAEGVLFTPHSKTFVDPKKSKPELDSLALMLKGIQGKIIMVGNTTQPASAQGRGRKRLPARDARTLAAERSSELVKALEKNGVPAESLAAAAFTSRMPDQGFKIKGDKTMIVISLPAPGETASAAPASAPVKPASSAPTATPAAPQQAKPASAAASAASATLKPAAPASGAGQQQPIPIGPAPQKKAP